MLVRLWSDKFIDAGEPRPVIEFHYGLNTVRGGTQAENSIGKSTLLSIVDYAFGGTDFLSSTAIHAVGHHTIFFTFRFNNVDATYSRSTDEPGYVQTYQDVEGRRPGERISIEEFRNDLKANYGLRGIDATFDEIVGRFFRIRSLRPDRGAGEALSRCHSADQGVEYGSQVRIDPNDGDQERHPVQGGEEETCPCRAASRSTQRRGRPATPRPAVSTGW